MELRRSLRPLGHLETGLLCSEFALKLCVSVHIFCGDIQNKDKKAKELVREGKDWVYGGGGKARREEGEYLKGETGGEGKGFLSTGSRRMTGASSRR